MGSREKPLDSITNSCGFVFFWYANDIKNRKITHACQWPILKASVQRTAITTLAWAQHSVNKKRGSSMQVCLSGVVQIKQNPSQFCSDVCSAPQQFWVFPHDHVCTRNLPIAISTLQYIEASCEEKSFYCQKYSDPSNTTLSGAKFAYHR